MQILKCCTRLSSLSVARARGGTHVLMSCIGILYYKCILYSAFCILCGSIARCVSCVRYVEEKERSRPRGVEREVVKGMMSRSGVSNGGGSVAWRITDDIGRRFSMRTPDNPPPVHLQRISILIPGQHLLRQCTAYSNVLRRSDLDPPRTRRAGQWSKQ